MTVIRFFFNKIHILFKKLQIKRIEKANKNRLKFYVENSNKNNEVKNVLFVVIHKSVWKLDTVFQKMLRSKRFNPIILIAPHTAFGYDQMVIDMNESFDFFKVKNYPVIKGLGNELKFDFIASFKPDIIFFTNPHDLTEKRYYSDLFMNYVSYYVPYYYQISKLGDYSMQYNQLFHNAMYRIFSPHSVALEIHKKYSTNKGKNVLLTGYPAMEPFMDRNYHPINPWKLQKNEKLKIIWAPHHTIDSPELPYSNFLKYAIFFKELVLKTTNTIQWAFKPHPVLKPKLIKHPDWGKDKTELYWNFWREHPNCQVEEGDYIDLFLTSDALIHDSGSFLVEYLYVNKPVLYLTSTLGIKKFFNELGSEAFDASYKAFSEEDINEFIKNVYNKNDPKIFDRKLFMDKHIYPFFNEKKPSDRIIESISNDFQIHT